MSLVLQNVKKGFKQGESRIDVLQGLNVEIDDGAIVSIVGQSGSGKSTLLSILAGLERSDSGEVIVGGKDISKLTEQELTKFRAENISIVFQQYHLVAHLTAVENVMLGLEILGQKDAEARAIKALEELGLGHRLEHFPSQLSGGECQRVAIARALVVNPKILLADEPSGNLDTHTGEKVMDVFFDVVKKHKITTILVTHSEQLADRCDRKLRLQLGQIKEA